MRLAAAVAYCATLPGRKQREQLACMQAGDDALDRKRGAHLLRQLMPTPCVAMPAWQTWLMLHSVLEEFAPHLVFAGLKQVCLFVCVCVCQIVH